MTLNLGPRPHGDGQKLTVPEYRKVGIGATRVSVHFETSAQIHQLMFCL